MPTARVSLLVLVCSFALVGAARAQVVPYDAALYGNLAAAWQQHVLRFPLQSNPITDTTGVHALVGQSGPVYYLVGAGTTDPVARSITIPAGKLLFFPMVTVECSTVEPDPFFGSNFAELSACAGSFFGATDTLNCAIDGVPVAGLNGYRTQSPLYAFAMPPRNNLLFVDGSRGGLSVTDGYWLLLEPLSVGVHTVHFTSSILDGGFTQDITYQITVR